jgi:hypothetical protein
MRQEMQFLILGSAGVRIYDPEVAMREALRVKMQRWIAGMRFDNLVMQDLRGIIRNLQGQPRDLALYRFPAELDALHCVAFKSLSPVSLKGSLLTCCKQLGINMHNGPDLFGGDHWASIVRSMEQVCEMPMAAELAVLGEVYPNCKTDAWVVGSILGEIDLALTSEIFDIEHLHRATNALDALVQGSGHVDEEIQLVRQAWAGLYAQNGKRFECMSSTVLSGFKEAVLTALCLNESSTCRLLGPEAWIEISALVVPHSIPLIQTFGPETDQVNTPRFTPTAKSFWQKVLGVIKR